MELSFIGRFRSFRCWCLIHREEMSSALVLSVFRTLVEADEEAERFFGFEPSSPTWN